MATKGSSKARQACWDNEVMGFVKSITKNIAYTDFEAAATTDYIDLATGILPANVIVLGWSANVTQAFGGGTVSAATLALGVSGTTDLYTASIPSVFTTGRKGAVCKTTGVAFNAADATPRLTLTCTGGNCSTLTAGAAEVKLYYMELN